LPLLTRCSPRIERSYSLHEVPDAVRHLAAGKVRGQIVIAIAALT
jgi:D-arabinose 1-dehydrogenase-like Zn-dependent alcohol dehydrogenase